MTDSKTIKNLKYIESDMTTFRYLAVNYKYLRQYFQIGLRQIKEQSSSMKKDQHLKNTTAGKNKKIKKKKSAPDKKHDFQSRTSVSIAYQSEMLQFVPDTAAIRQYKQQLHFVKNLMSSVVQQYNFSNDSISQQIDSLKTLLTFPSISIDRLFDHKETTIFKDRYISNDLTDYLKLVNNQLQQKRKKVILTIRNDSFLITEDSNKRQDNQEFKGHFITLLEREVFQNRQNFMEKIQTNQSKYQNCNSHLSEMSQQLLFLSKVYMENGSKIKKIGDQLALKMLSFFSQPESETQKLYYEVIMKKNIAYAVREHEIDFLNYFRKKQHEQRTFYVEMPEIKDQQEFFSFLKSKKPKKGKLAKFCLHTACSCCFSGYFEACNPIVACQNCNLRCHKLCYNLKQKNCGNCSYQRLLKSDKQIIPYCIICKKKGEMTIKLKDKMYAHGFCLIMHNKWKIEAKIESKESKKDLQKDCETFYNKISNFPFTSNQCLKSQDKKYELVFKEIQPRISSIETLDEEPDCLIQNQCFGVKNQKDQFDCQNKLYTQQSSENCNICTGSLYKDFYGSCVKCSKKSHAFCAFFEGFEFRDFGQGGKEQERNNKVNILFDCCSRSVQEKEKQKKSREYVLNRNRFLFDTL